MNTVYVVIQNLIIVYTVIQWFNTVHKVSQLNIVKTVNQWLNNV